MRHLHQIAIASILIGYASPSLAQYEGGIEIPENVLDAILERNEGTLEDENEIGVMLDPPDGGEQDADEENHPEEAKKGDPDDVVASVPEAIPQGATPAPESSPYGPTVRVQPLRDTTGSGIKAEDVKINAPFAAKPLGRPPEGWKLVSSAEVPAFTKNVEVAPGTWLTLAIRPHVLIPEADGQGVFQITEPGFDSELGYQQKATVSASIASSVRQLEDDSKLLGQVIDDLEQILISLPRPGSNNSTDNAKNR